MTTIKIKRGLNANVGTLTLADGELALVTDTNKLIVGPSKTVLNPDAPAAAVSSVAGKTGAVTLVKGDVGLGNVDNVQQAPMTHVGAGGTAHAAVTTSVNGFMISTDKSKLDGITAGAQPNRSIASQAQAETGTDNATDMTPLRVAQAVAASTIDGGTF